MPQAGLVGGLSPGGGGACPHWRRTLGARARGEVGETAEEKWIETKEAREIDEWIGRTGIFNFLPL
jgi:hypothetical protein